MHYCRLKKPIEMDILLFMFMAFVLEETSDKIKHLVGGVPAANSLILLRILL